MPARVILKAEAVCAVGPDGKIEIDLIRRNGASAQKAAGNVHGLAWPQLAAKGWQVVDVVIMHKAEAEVAEPEARPAPAPPGKPPRRPPPPTAPPPAPPVPRGGRGLDTVDRMPVEAYRAFLRCGGIR